MYELSQPLNPDLYGVAPNGVRVLEGMGCGLGCSGMGAFMDGTGLFGTGIFGPSVDVTNLSTWGIGEYAAIAVSLLVVFSLASTGQGAVQSVRKFRRRRAA